MNLEAPEGIGLLQQRLVSLVTLAWEAAVLPLNYTRAGRHSTRFPSRQRGGCKLKEACIGAATIMKSPPHVRCERRACQLLDKSVAIFRIVFLIACVAVMWPAAAQAEESLTYLETA